MGKGLALALAGAGAVGGYSDEKLTGSKLLLSPPEVFDPDKFVALGDGVIKSLELLETLRTRSFEGSLLWTIDRTCTGPGGRLLREWLIRPLREIEPLRARHDAVAALVENFELRVGGRNLLQKLADLERI